MLTLDAHDVHTHRYHPYLDPTMDSNPRDNQSVFSVLLQQDQSAAGAEEHMPQKPPMCSTHWVVGMGTNSLDADVQVRHIVVEAVQVLQKTTAPFTQRGWVYRELSTKEQNWHYSASLA